MAQNFRSAFNGFNREDVVHYLEFLNNKHTAQINQLTSDAEFLRQQLASAPREDPEKDLRIADLEERCSELEQELAAAREARAALEQKCEQLEKSLAEAQAAKAEVPAAPAAYQADQELEAYRRAERAERIARERAELVYRQTNSILTEATAKVDDAACQIGSIVDMIGNQMELLQNAVDSSKLALRDAAATMYHIRPNSDI